MQTLNKEETQEMMAIWPDIVHDIMEAAFKHFNFPDVTKWLEKVLEYNVPKGKKIRGLALIHAYKLLISNDQLTEENIRLARILAWCVELRQAFSLMIDDVIDRSLLRRDQPCWYRYNNINEAAINDGILLENAAYYIIRKHFKGKDCYINLLETFHDVAYTTLMGRCLDILLTNFGKKPNLDLFTMDQFNSLANWKTAYYTFHFPVTAAMNLAGIKDPEMFKQATNILLEIGRFFHSQDDYLSCFGNPEICGKDNTDIQEGKSTWCIVVALERATPKQRKILEECYGVSDPEKIDRVKQLFVDLNLRNAYSAFEKETYNLINVHIQQISCGLPHNLFSDLLRPLYRRVS